MLSSVLGLVGVWAQKIPSWAPGDSCVANSIPRFSFPDNGCHSEVHLPHPNSPDNWLVLGGLVTCGSYKVLGRKPGWWGSVCWVLPHSGQEAAAVPLLTYGRQH